ncbi:hypothetical protein DWZ93_04905 [Dorea sp. AF36-15AT]|nr:hypothetical protein DWZ93_04905 [Dorea sp. AF36-15AT]
MASPRKPSVPKYLPIILLLTILINVSIQFRLYGKFFQECLGILAARCASCNCMTYFYCAPLQSCRRLYQLGGLTPS